MPAKNTRKIYQEGGYYHLYNRGVDKRTIFTDKQDYGVFLSYLKTYLIPKEEPQLMQKLASPKLPWPEKDKILRLLRLNNFSKEITLLTYCLMPNHFHMLVKQTTPNAIDKFMNSLHTRYVVYFNKRHKRVGTLYEGVYKAVLVESDEQLLHLSAYIHRNPYNLSLKGLAFKRLTQQPSSLPEYLRYKKTPWVETNQILSFFSRVNPSLSYKNFVISYNQLNSIINPLIFD